MTPADRDILELLENEGADRELVLTPGLIAENTDWSRSTVRSHLMELRDHGLVEYYDEDRSIHQLTNRGRDYLRGEISPDHLEE
ncbi:hypothetical protein CP557_02275 [Natrinema ejinorense]|uniref:HTH iclR-type domain-containing protein n=2 Tax=Natrinema ejinorense TaxID=373386 RepID=A0A2A5R0M2_9EURY|nr:winged helix-turn-helix domain-containing protein [Natrinema ejinorense]PCR92573.1 hypothetical protein CP557_02275 [Natrinema ejinorense]